MTFADAGVLAGGSSFTGPGPTSIGTPTGAGKLGPIAGATGRALDDIANLPTPIPLTGKLPIDRIESLFAKGDTAGPLSVGGKDFTSTPNKVVSTRLFDTADIPDAELATEARRIATELAGGKELIPTRDGRAWYAKLEDGTTVNLRLVSTSGVSRWTIDILNDAFPLRAYAKPKLEIKLE